MLSGRCHRTTLIILPAGDPLKAILHINLQSKYPLIETPRANTHSGNGAFGSIRYVMMLIFHGILIISTIIQLNMAMLSRWKTGLIQTSTVLLRKRFVHWIGGVRIVTRFDQYRFGKWFCLGQAQFSRISRAPSGLLACLYAAWLDRTDRWTNTHSRTFYSGFCRWTGGPEFLYGNGRDYHFNCQIKFRH